MIPIEELRTENRAIEELCQVLSRVADLPTLEQNSVICELIDRFIARVDKHLEHESRDVYKDLLHGHGAQAKTVAEQFLDNSHELHRLCERYKKRWTKNRKCAAGNGEGLGADISEFVDLVRARIALENERLFPLLG